MIIVIVLLGVALVVSLAFNLGLVGGAQKPTAQASANTSPAQQSRTDDERARKAEAELEKKSKELGEIKRAQAELKEELKATKKRVHEQKTDGRSGDDLVRARAEVERQASMQLDATRAELATALADIQKLKTEADTRNKKRAEPVAAEARPEAVKVERPAEVITRVIRELSDVEKERIAKLEAQSSNDRKKANELDREIKSVKAKFDRHTRESKRVYQDAELARDKFRAVELRLNRTAMENDLLKRAIKDLEKKSGVDAGRLALTAEEIATGDATMKSKHAAEDAAEVDARARLEAALPTPGEAAPASDAPVAAAETAAAPATEPAVNEPKPSAPTAQA